MFIRKHLLQRRGPQQPGVQNDVSGGYQFLSSTKSLGPRTEWEGDRDGSLAYAQTGLPLSEADLCTATAECSLQRLDPHYAVVP